MAGCLRTRRSEVTLIPAQLAGWLTVEYSAPNTQPLTWDSKEKAYVITMPASGRYETSSPMKAGLANDRYFLLDSSGKRTALPVSDGTKALPKGIQEQRFIKSASLNGEPGREVRAFFVGTPSEFASAPKDDSSLMRR
jgi:hypothetical protein